MREVVADCETSGMNVSDGHRIIEIGMIELINQLPTGRELQLHIDPEREIDPGATRVHGKRWSDLKGCPKFADVADQILDFIGDSQVVGQNLQYDLAFLNAELERIGRKALGNPTVCTLKLAIAKFPGAAASLDALCRRFAIDLSGRTLHGAALDARLTADVYLCLLGGRQQGLALQGGTWAVGSGANPSARVLRAPRRHSVDPAELARWQEFIRANVANPIWLQQGSA